MRTTWGYVLILTVLIIQRSFTTSAQLTQPMNTVSFVGDRVKMECSSNSSLPVEWEFTAAGSSDFLHIYTVGQITESLSSKYKIDTNGKTRYDIVIDSVDFSHAGKYRCTHNTEEVISTPSYTAQIIVLASDPVCNTNASALNGHNMEGDYIRMWCTVNFTGNWIPVMEWTRCNGQTVDVNIDYTNTSTTVTSSLTVQLYSNDNGATFKCKTSFNPPSTKINVTLKPGETLATNVPKYQHLWDFDATVLYAPNKITIMPMKSVYVVGDRLVCWANGNPTPTYEWMEIETNRTIPGSVLTIDNHMTSDKNHSFSCTAYNTVVGFRRQIAETITFSVKGRPEIPTEQPIIISIIVVGAVCCFVLTLYLCKNRCPYKSGIVRPEPDILQAVQINPYDIAESMEDHPTNRLRSEQAVHQPGVEGGNLQQQPPLPVYAEVRRKENKTVADDSEHQPLQPLSPVYSLVKKETREPMNSDGPRQTVETTATQYRLPPRTLTGADGTQYLDVTSIRDQISRAPIRHPPMFSVVETYASIDHTVGAPPPLPPKRQ